MNNITIIGLGYIGLPLACILGKINKITCIDNNKSKISNLKKKIIPFKEKNLDILFKKNFSNLNFQDKILKTKNKETYIVCVPTPLKKRKLICTIYTMFLKI